MYKSVLLDYSFLAFAMMCALKPYVKIVLIPFVEDQFYKSLYIVHDVEAMEVYILLCSSMLLLLSHYSLL